MEEMDVEVPSHFLCPISLQLMRDPVTVSTGITYDRPSIERWLYSSSYHKIPTCPVTKQPLSNTSKHGIDDHHLTPNHTLRRLIQSWCNLNLSSGIEPIPTPKPPVDKSQIIKLIKDANKSPRSLSKCLQRLKSIAMSVNGSNNRKSLQGSGIVDFLASVIVTGVVCNNGNVTDHESSSSASDIIISNEVDEALFILHQLEKSIDIELKKLINDQDNVTVTNRFISSLIHILTHGHSQSRTSSLTLLNSIYNISDPNHLINAPKHLFLQIFTLISTNHLPTKSALKLLVELNKWGRNRIKAVQSNGVTTLIELLLTTNEKRLCELTLNVLDQLCSCAEGRAELLNHGAGLAVISKKILRVSNVASDKGVRILNSVCKYSGTGKVLGEMLEVGVVAKLCLVIQVDCGIKAKEKAKEILRLHSRDWRNSGCIPPHLLSSFPSN